mgnify:CR=1 FL=1
MTPLNRSLRSLRRPPGKASRSPGKASTGPKMELGTAVKGVGNAVRAFQTRPGASRLRFAPSGVLGYL